jgi:CMP-N-acetylneuraminic acid synthetase
MKVTALLPMKEHSDRVPNKNIKVFGGKPLYHIIMQSLMASDLIEKIVINTDSNHIAKDAKRHFEHVQIISRSEQIRGDFVSMNEIIAYDLGRLDGEYFLQTHSTNPLLQSETIDRAIESYFKGLDKFDSLFSVTRAQMRLYWSNGKPINHNPQELLRTQDLAPVFEENSNFYIFSKTSFFNADNNRIGLKPQMFEMDKLEAIDIDDLEDFELAEILYTKRTKVKGI